MDEQERPSKLRDALVTILGVWGILIATGLIFTRLQPSPIAATASLAACVGLLYSWSRWLGPGRRTHLAIYLLAGVLYLVLVTVLMLSVPSEWATGPLLWLGAGLTIGFQPQGGPHTPLEFYIIPFLFNLFGPILVMGFLRLLSNRDQTG